MDITPFEGLTKKTPWNLRMRVINDEFPSTVKLDWERAFDDIELFGRVLRDILKVDQTVPGRSGPRPVLDRSAAQERLRQFMRTDYSELPFTDALRVLSGGRSRRALAHKTGLDRNTIQRIMTGQKEPTLSIMEEVARAFKKQPSYFLEYRVAYILGALASRMEHSPEITVDLYNRLTPRSKS